MIHAIFEFSPFLAGLLVGLLAQFRTVRRPPRPWIIGGTSLLIGSVCSFFAGELTQGLAFAALCIAWDSVIAAAGAVTAHLVFRRMWA